MTYSNIFKIMERENSGAEKLLPREVVAATKLLPKGGIWKKDVSNEQKIETMKTWLKTVSEIYGLDVPEFRFDDNDMMYNLTGGGHYEPWAKRITLFKKFSMVTLMHEFRHYMQDCMELDMYRDDAEEDARGWSVSLYKAACPKSYQNAVDKGILHFN